MVYARSVAGDELLDPSRRQLRCKNQQIPPSGAQSVLIKQTTYGLNGASILQCWSNSMFRLKACTPGTTSALRRITVMQAQSTKLEHGLSASQPSRNGLYYFQIPVKGNGRLSAAAKRDGIRCKEGRSESPATARISVSDQEKHTRLHAGNEGPCWQVPCQLHTPCS